MTVVDGYVGLFTIQSRDDYRGTGVTKYIDGGARHVQNPVKHQQHADGLHGQPYRTQDDCNRDQGC